MLRFLLCGSVLIFAAAKCHASIPTIGIDTVDGAVEVTNAPPSLRNDAFQSSEYIRIFLERERYVDELEVNAVRLGTYNAYADFSDRTIRPYAGVRSFLIHYDQVGNSAERLGGSITFEQPILGVIGRSRTLEATDPEFGAVGTLYPTVREGRQVEYDRPDDHDFFRLEPDGRTIYAFMQVTTKFDQIRVITAVPEPTTAILITATLIVSACIRQQRQANTYI